MSESNPDVDKQRPGRIRAYHRKPEETPAPKSQRELDAQAVYDEVYERETEKAEIHVRKREHQEMPFTLTYRNVKESDFHFVLNAWLMSYRDSYRHLNNTDYFAGQQNLIAEIASRRNCALAVDSEIPDFIVGFAVGTPLSNGKFLLDYVYVKQGYRERGIASSIIKHMGATSPDLIIATHRNKAVQATMARKQIGFNPYYNMIGYSDV